MRAPIGNMYTRDEKRWLLSLARDSVCHYLKARRSLTEKPDGLPPGFLEKRGVFVTLNRDSALRGCIGNIEPLYPVYQSVMKNAVNAAFGDPRFPPLTDAELADLSIGLSILTAPEPLEYKNTQEFIKKLVPNRHGVILRKGVRSATFLPQVWEQISRPEDFLSHLCVKGGLEPYEWQKGDMDVETYTTESFDDKEVIWLAG